MQSRFRLSVLMNLQLKYIYIERKYRKPSGKASKMEIYTYSERIWNAQMSVL